MKNEHQGIRVQRTERRLAAIIINFPRQMNNREAPRYVRQVSVCRFETQTPSHALRLTYVRGKVQFFIDESHRRASFRESFKALAIHLFVKATGKVHQLRHARSCKSVPFRRRNRDVFGDIMRFGCAVLIYGFEEVRKSGSNHLVTFFLDGPSLFRDSSTAWNDHRNINPRIMSLWSNLVNFVITFLLY